MIMHDHHYNYYRRVTTCIMPLFFLQCMIKRDGPGLSLPHHMSSECGMEQVLTVLAELERFLSASNNPRERKNRQKLLRNLKVLLKFEIKHHSHV